MNICAIYHSVHLQLAHRSGREAQNAGTLLAVTYAYAVQNAYDGTLRYGYVTSVSQNAGQDFATRSSTDVSTVSQMSACPTERPQSSDAGSDNNRRCRSPLKRSLPRHLLHHYRCRRRRLLPHVTSPTYVPVPAPNYRRNPWTSSRSNTLPTLCGVSTQTLDYCLPIPGEPCCQELHALSPCWPSLHCWLVALSSPLPEGSRT